METSGGLSLWRLEPAERKERKKSVIGNKRYPLRIFASLLKDGFDFLIGKNLIAPLKLIRDNPQQYPVDSRPLLRPLIKQILSLPSYYPNSLQM